MHFDTIKSFPDFIQLTFSDLNVAVVAKSEFSPRSGYLFKNEETDPPETPLFWVNPDAALSDFSFMWHGSNDDYDVVITAYKGLLSATISGTAGRYVIERQLEGYQLIHVNSAGFPSYAGDIVTTINKSSAKNLKPTADTSFVSNLKTFDFSTTPTTVNKDAVNPSVIDMLIVYNEEARIEAGGSPADPNDTLAMEQQIIAEIDNLNITLTNSANTTRVTMFHVAKLNDFEIAPGAGDRTLETLENFRILTSVNNLRNQVGADLVSGILGTDFARFAVCGIAHGHTAIDPINPEWIIGAGFSEYAYNLTSQFCILYDNTFSHEFGHLLGAHHARDEKYTPVDTVVNNGFPYAFAHRSGSFKSLMSITQNTEIRRLNFSNPNIQVDSIITGVDNLADNHRVVEELAVFVTNYRQRTNLIFANGFE